MNDRDSNNNSLHSSSSSSSCATTTMMVLLGSQASAPRRCHHRQRVKTFVAAVGLLLLLLLPHLLLLLLLLHFSTWTVSCSFSSISLVFFLDSFSVDTTTTTTTTKPFVQAFVFQQQQQQQQHAFPNIARQRRSAAFVDLLPPPKSSRYFSSSSRRLFSTGGGAGSLLFTTRPTFLSSCELQEKDDDDETNAGDTNNDDDNNNKSGNSKNNKNKIAIKLVSWNLLAPCYVDESKYSQCDAVYLNWSYRKRKIVQNLRNSQADVIFLQEVDWASWIMASHHYQDHHNHHHSNNNNNNNNTSDDATNTTNNDNDDDDDDWYYHYDNVTNTVHLSETLSYQAVVQTLKRGHPVANVILLRQGLGAVVVATESRSRALLTVLEFPTTKSATSANTNTTTSQSQQQDQEQGRKLLYLANVHLEAGFQCDDTRWNQIKSLMKRLNNHIVKYHDSETLGDNNNNNRYASSSPCIVLAGDFNMKRSNPIYYLLETGTMPNRAVQKQLEQQQVEEERKRKTKLFRRQQQRTLQQQQHQRTPSSLSQPRIPWQEQVGSILPSNDKSTTPSSSSSSLSNPKQQISSPSPSTTATTMSVLPHLPLVDAYLTQPPLTGPVCRTYCGGAILDYIWVSQSIRVLETWQSHPDASCVPPATATPLHEVLVRSIKNNNNTGTFQTMTDSKNHLVVVPKKGPMVLQNWHHMHLHPLGYHRVPRVNWPSQDHPSDHLPIGAILEF